MKAILFLGLGLLCCTLGRAQATVTDLLSKMGDTQHQFKDTFDPGALNDQLTIIYIPGSNDPFGKIYDKHKGKELTGNVQFIGGFREMMRGADPDRKRSHLQEAFRTRYGKEHFTILIDLESEIAQMLSIKGYSILGLSKKENRIISFRDYGFDRIAFFKDLKKYFKS